MTDISFPWIFISLAAIVDLVGLFHLWRRRHSTAGINHRYASGSARRMRIPPAERRRADRRRSSRAASA